jgi:lipoate-protein ligase A
MTEKLFAQLNVYHDNVPRSGAMNMAIDEALLEMAEISAIRFYCWESPGLSFGYFGKFAEVAGDSAGRDLVRRWTGGGMVFHGDDLTYTIVIPANEPAFSESSISIYEKVHLALSEALIRDGKRVQLLSVAAVCDRRSQANNATATERRYSKRACFANPVPADVMLDGRKIAGAAQRRTRAGLLHQGSIQHVDLANGLAERFSRALSLKCHARNIGCELLRRAEAIAAQKYGTEAWLRKR